MDQHFPEFPEIQEWLKQQPLSILQLDAADRIVLFIAGKSLQTTVNSLPNCSAFCLNFIFHAFVTTASLQFKTHEMYIYFACFAYFSTFHRGHTLVHYNYQPLNLVSVIRSRFKDLSYKY